MRDPPLCNEVRKQLEVWSLHAPEPQRSRLVRALTELSCSEKGTPRELAK